NICDKIIVGGDFNTNICKPSTVTDFILNKFALFDILPFYDSLPDLNVSPITFRANLSCSFIDHFLVKLSPSIVSNISFKIIDHPLNYSDHLPISVNLNVNLTTKIPISRSISDARVDELSYKKFLFNWTKA